MFNKYSLRQIWTTIILFATLVPVSLVMVWYGQQLYNVQLNSGLKTERQANNALRNQIDNEVKRFKTLLQNKSDTISILLKRPLSEKKLQNINSLLKIIINREPAIRELAILNRQGRVLAAIAPETGITGKKLLSVKQAEAILLHWGFNKKTEYPEMVIPLYGRIYTGSPKAHEDYISFNIAIPVGHPANAVLIARVDVNRLWGSHKNKFDVFPVKPTHYILDRRGSLITSVEGSNKKSGEIMTHLEIVRSAIANREWNVNRKYIGILNEPVYGTLTPIPSLNWSLVSEVATSKITGPIWLSITKIILFTLIGVIVFIWVVLYLTNKTLKSIDKTCEAINYAAKGDYQHSLNTCGIRELDALSIGFNNMVIARQNVESLLHIREKNLVESRRLYRSLFEKSADALLIIKDNKITDCNHATLEMLGYATKKEVCELLPSELSPEYQSDGELSEVKFRKTTELALKKGSYRFEWLLKRKDNGVFPVEVLFTAIDYQDNKLLHVVWRDITLQKQQEESLRHALKIEALGKLTGGIAHDYNNMLGVIIGYADILNEYLAEQPRLLNYVKQIKNASERGAKLTRKLLTFSRYSQSDLEKSDLNQLLKDTEHMLGKVLTARIKLVLNLEDMLWPVLLDKSEFDDAVLNMCINSMHAISESGQVTLTTCNKILSADDAQTLHLQPGDYVLFIIEDDGCGMDEDTKNRIFDPFYTTKGEQGSGLGLSQVYGLVNRCEGAIRVDSMPEQGTRLTLYFPRYKGSDTNKHRVMDKDKVDLQGNETILVVDDEHALLNLTCEVLKQSGYKVYCAEHGREALNILKDNHVDLVISDVIMPDMDGYKLASIVQDKYPEIKIQLASGYSNIENTNQVDKTLSQNILHKPYNSKELLERVRTLL